MLAGLAAGATLTFAIDVAKTKMVAAFAVGSEVRATVTWQQPEQTGAAPPTAGAASSDALGAADPAGSPDRPAFARKCGAAGRGGSAHPFRRGH